MLRRDDIQLSKRLSWILRHGAVKEGIPISDEGFIEVDVLRKHRSLSSYSIEDIKRVVHTNDKQRFTLRDISGKLCIRANQGHSLEVSSLELIPIINSEQIPEVIHGTFFKFLKQIQEQGLNRVSRNHIHFAPSVSNKYVISGVRKNSEVYIFINLDKALSDGLQFFQSANGVILSQGDKNGFIKPRYFSKIIKASGEVLKNYEDGEGEDNM